MAESFLDVRRAIVDLMRDHADDRAMDLLRLNSLSDQVSNFVMKALKRGSTGNVRSPEFLKLKGVASFAASHWNGYDDFACKIGNSMGQTDGAVERRCLSNAQKLGVPFEDQIASEVTAEELQAYRTFCLQADSCNATRRALTFSLIIAAIPFCDREMLVDAKGILEMTLARDVDPSKVRKSIVEYVWAKLDENGDEVKRFPTLRHELGTFFDQTLSNFIFGSPSDQKRLNDTLKALADWPSKEPLLNDTCDVAAVLKIDILRKAPGVEPGRSLMDAVEKSITDEDLDKLVVLSEKIEAAVNTWKIDLPLAIDAALPFCDGELPTDAMKILAEFGTNPATRVDPNHSFTRGHRFG